MLSALVTRINFKDFKLNAATGVLRCLFAVDSARSGVVFDYRRQVNLSIFPGNQNCFVPLISDGSLNMLIMKVREDTFQIFFNTISIFLPLNIYF